ncbi:MAG: TonB-dependent receptor [Pseudomonadota bacterium]|jgi:TonB-dependent receptor
MLIASVFAMPIMAHAQSTKPTDAEPETTGTKTIVVTGNRKVAQTTAQEQVASPNAIAVLSPETIERAPDVNIAEALARLPGVSVFNGGQGNTNSVFVDIAGRGQGNYVSLRGMAAEYNINLINGVEGAQGMPFSRQVPLNLLPPSGMHRVVVNKSFLATEDGGAIGGSIDFRTPTAADFENSSALNVSVTGRINTRARDYGQKSDGETASLEVAHGFGESKAFTIYVGGYYDRSNFTNTIIDGVYPAATNGQWAYASQNKDGTSASGLSPAQNLTSTGVNAGFTQGTNQRYGGSLSLDWTPSDTQSWYLRGTYAQNEITQNSYYAQIYGDSVGQTQIGTSGVYAPSIGQIRPRYYFTTSPEQALLATAQFGGKLKLGKLTLQPNVFFSYGEYNAPDHQEISARKPNSGTAIPYSGSTMFTYQNGIPLLIGSAAQYAYINDIANYNARRSGDLSAEFSHQSKYGAKFDADIDVDSGFLKTISFGAKYRDAYRKHTYNDYYTPRVYNAAGAEVNWTTLGIFGGTVGSIVPGVYNFAAPLINRGALDQVFNKAILATYGSFPAADDSCNDPNPAIKNVNNQNCNTQTGHERITSLYAMGTFETGHAEILAGLRYEHTGITNTFWVLPTDGTGAEIAGNFASSKTTYDKVLPSLALNYRPTSGSVYRLSVSRSYVAPSFFQLAGGQRINRSSGGAEAGGTTSITKGNPNLKALDSTNVDASAEFSSAKTSGSISAFYKHIENFTYSRVNSFTNVTSSKENGSTTISQPVNGGAGDVYGLELAASTVLDPAASIPGHFILSGNVTLEGSSVDPKGGLSSNERLLNQPNLTGNAQLSYVLGTFQADLSYRYIGSYVYQYAVIDGKSDLDGWVRANSQLDLHVGYRYGRAKLEAALSNLTNQRSYYATIGRNSSTIGSIVDSGRTATMKVSYQF